MDRENVSMVFGFAGLIFIVGSSIGAVVTAGHPFTSLLTLGIFLFLFGSWLD